MSSMALDPWGMVAPARKAAHRHMCMHGEDTRDTTNANAGHLGEIHTTEHTLRPAGRALHEFRALGYRLLEAPWTWTYWAQGGLRTDGGYGLTDVGGTAHFSPGLGVGGVGGGGGGGVALIRTTESRWGADSSHGPLNGKG